VKIPKWATAAMMILFVGGMAVGAYLKEQSITRVQQQRAEVYRQIEDVIVKRNPGASIRDFAGFPEFLIAESAKAGIDFRLAMAMIDIESEWKADAVSHKKAIGLMQVVEATGADMAKRLAIPDYRGASWTKAGGFTDLGSLGDPKTNVRIGLAYLALQRDSFGMKPAALRAYNRGPSSARLAWPYDRYAEDVSFRFVALVHEIPGR
jgi:soluble lytic murein transglycosylase-like protein